MSFKQFFYETKDLVYDHPPERAKFQLGDIVIVRDDGRWKMYQPKKSEPYINQVGEVVGYKNVPGGYTKFALKFSDGNTLLIHSHFLFGPFKDLKTAQKYTNPGLKIAPTDIKQKQGVKVLAEYQKRDNVEIFLKDFLPKIGYTWLKQPIEVLSKDSKYILTVFATRDIEYCQLDKYSHNIAIQGKYSCYRVNNAGSKKLKSAMGVTLNGILNESAHSGGMGYFIEAPGLNGSNRLTINKMFELYEYGIPNNPELLKKDELISYFADVKTKIQQIKSGKFNTDLDLIKLFYKVEGDTIASHGYGEVEYDKVQLKDPNFFKPYKIIGDFRADIDMSNIKDLSFLPKEVTGDLRIHDWSNYNLEELNFKNLNGMPPVGENIDVSRLGLESLEGSPKIVNGDFDCSANKLTNFIGGPEKVKGDFDFSQNQLTSLAGLPKAKLYNFTLAKLNGRDVTQQDIDLALLKHKMSPDAKETFGGLMDEL